MPPLDPQKQCLAYIPLTWHAAWLHGKNYEWLNAGLLWLYLPKENGILISTYSKASISQFLFQWGSYEIIFSVCPVVKTPRAAKKSEHFQPESGRNGEQGSQNQRQCSGLPCKFVIFLQKSMDPGLGLKTQGVFPLTKAAVLLT